MVLSRAQLLTAGQPRTLRRQRIRQDLLRRERPGLQVAVGLRIGPDEVVDLEVEREDVGCGNNADVLQEMIKFVGQGPEPGLVAHQVDDALADLAGFLPRPDAEIGAGDAAALGACRGIAQIQGDTVGRDLLHALDREQFAGPGFYSDGIVAGFNDVEAVDDLRQVLDELLQTGFFEASSRSRSDVNPACGYSLRVLSTHSAVLRSSSASSSSLKYPLRVTDEGGDFGGGKLSFMDLSSKKLTDNVL